MINPKQLPQSLSLKDQYFPKTTDKSLVEIHENRKYVDKNPKNNANSRNRKSPIPLADRDIDPCTFVSNPAFSCKDPGDFSFSG